MLKTVLQLYIFVETVFFIFFCNLNILNICQYYITAIQNFNNTYLQVIGNNKKSIIGLSVSARIVEYGYLTQHLLYAVYYGINDYVWPQSNIRPQNNMNLLWNINIKIIYINNISVKYRSLFNYEWTWTKNKHM